MTARPAPILLCALLALPLPACGRKAATPAAAPSGDPVAPSVQPSALAAAIRARGGARAKTRARFIVATDPKAVRAQSLTVAAPDAGAPRADDVTTISELTVDREGHFRLLESNDHDGGREVHWYAGGLAVALRHGKLIRQPPDDRAAARVLSEALGAPFAAWELAGMHARLTPVAGDGFTVALRDAPPSSAAPASAVAPAGGPAAALTAWRNSVQIEELSGELRLAPDAAAKTSPLLVAFHLTGRFSARQGAQPVAGYFDVSFELDQLGAVANIEAPAAEELLVPQRTILDERALLGGLPSRPQGAPAAKPPAAPRPTGAPSDQKH